MRSPSAIWKTRSIPCCAVTGRTICGNWRPIWRAKTSSRKRWNRCSPSSIADTARAALVRIAASVEIANLLNEIESSTSRISDLVRAIKEYTYMDQAPVQNVDIVKSLENTLTILNHKLKQGVMVQRDYHKDSAAGKFIRQRTQPGLDQHHRQRDRRDERQGRAAGPNLSRGQLRGG